MIVASDRAIVDEAHIATRSLNNCSTAFHSHIDLFVLQYLEFVPARSCSEADALSFWLALGMQADMAEELARSDLHWDGARLRVHADFEDQHAFGRITSMVLHLMRWVDFSDTRWVGSGPSGRLFLASLAGGMDALHRLCRNDPHVSGEKLAGVARATRDVRLFLSTAAFSSYVTESVGVEVLEDDRFLRRGAELWELLEEEVAYIHDLPEIVWSRTSSLIGGDPCPQELRDICLMASHIAASYLWDDSFSQLATPPLSLTQGDIAGNVAALAEAIGGAHIDPVSAQVVACLQMGIPAAQLIALLEMIRDGPSTINVVEQGHASHAVVLKLHQKLQERMLRARSSIHQCRAVLRPARQRSRVNDIEHALDQLDRRQIQRSRFRSFSSLFSDDQVAAALGQDAPAAGRLTPAESLAARRRLFSQLPAAALPMIDRLVQAQAADRRQRIQEERAQLLGELARARAAAAEEHQQEGLRNRVSDCAFNDEDWERLLEAFNAVGANDLRRAESQVFDALEVPCEAVRQAFEAHYPEEAAQQWPWWARRIAMFRDTYRGTLVFGGAWFRVSRRCAIQLSTTDPSLCWLEAVY